MKKIRVAMIRCDGHAYTYAPLMARCDVALYRKYFHCEYYWMIDSYSPDKLKTEMVKGFDIVKTWDYDRTKAERFSETCFGKPRICRTLEEAGRDIDAAFVCDCDGDGADHLKLARPFLKKGIPTFIDKPFANCVKNAKALVALARRHRAPLYSASILREVNEITYLKARLPEAKGALALGVVKGVGPHLAGVIHGLSLAQGVFGEGVESVDCIGDGDLEHVLIHYRNGAQVTVLNTPASCFDWFLCDVYTNPGRYGNPPTPCHLRSNTIGDAEYIGGGLNILRKFRRMVTTRTPPIPYEALVELIAIVDAGRMSQKKRRRIYLKDIV